MGKIAAAAALAGGLTLAGGANAAEYVNVVHTVDVAKPIAVVMQKTGGYCDIGAWIKASCVITSGKDRELGAVRRIADRIEEMIVATTPTSYTYAQPLAPNSYHGTVEYRPIDGGKATRIVYTLFWDTSVNADQAAKDKDAATRTATAKRFAEAMKTQAEQ